jgi:hypothetical protein
MKKIFIIFIISLFYIKHSKSQYYVNGQDPFSIDWKKIETPHFKIIFSKDISALGQTYAGYLEKIYKTGGQTLNHYPRKIPVIIHNQTILSNGEVAWAPRRMNLYTVPPQSGYTMPYMYNLALHEFRHVVQIDKLNTSSTRFLYYIFGEQAVAGLLGWHVPLWFLEGDAVAYETGASNDGRGRIPDFTMRLKAQVLEKGVFSYPKAQFGSYKDFVPNHYELGYQLEVIAREKYGVDIWKKTLGRVAKSPISFNAFSKGIKKETGLPERKLYKESINYFKDINREDSNTVTSGKSKDYINYYSPYIINDEMVISYKTSYNEIPKIVITNKNGEDKTIIKTGYIYDKIFTYNDSILVWNEMNRTRWENNNYNMIVVYNMRNNKKRYLTQQTKAFYSEISPDNKKILSVEVDKSLKWSITIRDIESGDIVDSILFENKQPLQPSWSPDMSSIVFLQLDNYGKSLNILDVNTHRITTILESGNVYMSNPFYHNSDIVIKGIYNNRSNFIKFNTQTKQWSSITNVVYGVGEGCFNDKKFIYTNYTSNGYKLKTDELSKLQSNAIDMPERYKTEQLQKLIDDEQKVSFINIDTTFSIENYSRLKHLINIHSWAPLSINLQTNEVGLGVSVMSQNHLSTSIFSGGYLYDNVNNTQEYYAQYSYKGFYPIFDNKFYTRYSTEIQYDNNGNAHSINYRDINFNTDITTPFNLSRGRWNRTIKPTVSYNYKYITGYELDNKLLDIGIHNIYYQLYFHNLQVKSYRDLQSRWGQAFRFKYMSSPFNLSQMGQLASGEMWLYMPGFMKNQGLKLYSGYQIKEYGTYKYYDQISYPFGYQRVNNTQMLSLQAFYSLPLLYPDLNIFEYLYIKRIKSTLFYQHSYFTYNSNTQLASTGIDFLADMHIFRFPAPVELGVRYARLLSIDDNYYQLLLNISFK